MWKILMLQVSLLKLALMHMTNPLLCCFERTGLGSAESQEAYSDHIPDGLLHQESATVCPEAKNCIY